MTPTPPQELRDWLLTRHGTDHGVTDDVLEALIARAEAKRRALGYGSVYVMVGGWLTELDEGLHVGGS